MRDMVNTDPIEHLPSIGVCHGRLACPRPSWQRTGNGLQGTHVRITAIKLGLLVAWILPCTGAQMARAEDPGETSRRLRRTHVVEVVEKTRNSVVNISSTQIVKARRSSIFGSFFDEVFAYPTKTDGSGFVIHEDGYIVTNDHVVSRSAGHRVTFADGSSYEAVVIASDPAHDLAVVKIEPDAPLVPLELGSSDDIMIGEEAIAIGNPFGLQNTVTRGVISALHRRLEFSPDVVYDDLIQTDASINPGNSGGPLLNAVGELIGINTAIRAKAENVSFAIPVGHLRRLLPDILDITQLKQVQFGMRVTGDTAEVVAIDTDSPADKAGIRLGDTVTSVGNRVISRDVDFYIAMLKYSAGDLVPMTLVRDRQPRQAKVLLTAVPQIDGQTIAWEKLGLRLEELSSAASRRFRLKRHAGVVIIDVDLRGPARRGPFRSGDLLVKLGRYRAWPLKSVGTLLQEVHPDEPVDVTVLRFYTDGSVERIEQRLYAK